jgi:integrase
VDKAALTVSAYLDDWLAAGARRWRASTAHNYGTALHPARVAFGGKRLQDLTRSDVEALVMQMLTHGGHSGTGRSPSTVRQLLVILGSAMREAVRDGLLVRNPCEYVRRPTGVRREMPVWSPAQSAAFLHHIRGHPLAGVFALSLRGLRRGEVLGLAWGDLDLDAATVTVRAARIQAGPQVVTGPPKSSRGRRTLPLDAPVVEALRWTYEVTVARSTVRPFTQPSRLLVAVDGAGAPVSPAWYSREFAMLAARAGLPSIRLHDLRHSAVTTMLAAGVPLHVAAAYAGHSPAVAMAVYAHATTDSLRAASEAFAPRVVER